MFLSQQVELCKLRLHLIDVTEVEVHDFEGALIPVPASESRHVTRHPYVSCPFWFWYVGHHLSGLLCRQECQDVVK